MKKINVIEVFLSHETGVQNFYETPREIKENFPNIQKSHLNYIENRFKEGDILGYIKGNGYTEEAPGFIQIFKPECNFLGDEYEILE